MRKATWLLEFKSNVYSQTGEDGIIEKILEVLDCNDKWCVEFGAWDGLFLTNTRHLIESKGFSAVLIEADKKKFNELQRNYSQYNVTTINNTVGFGDEDNLDQLLSDTEIPCDFSVLSIDIDGNDYHVWKRIKKYKPMVVVIEFNPTIPTHIRFVQHADPNINQGASLLSLVELGKEKGYELVSALPFNAFFVKKEYYQLFEMETNSPEALCTVQNICYLFSGYDGSVFLSGNCRLPWHDIKLKESSIQPLPKFLRKYPCNYNMVQRIVFNLFLLFKDPGKFKKNIDEWLNCLRS